MSACKDCKFCYDGSDFRQCRRYPPKPTFPIVDGNHWCGEFIPLVVQSMNDRLRDIVESTTATPKNFAPNPIEPESRTIGEMLNAPVHPAIVPREAQPPKAPTYSRFT